MNTINTKVQELQQQKEALDARIAKLEELENSTTPVKNLLVSLLANYATEASEELPIIWEEILAIGQQHGLSVQPLAADELRQWEADRMELENLRLEVGILRSQLPQVQQVQPDNELKVWRKGEIAKVPDFAEQTPEYIVTIDSGKPITNVWISLREVDSKLARVWRYKGQKDEIGYATKEAAAIAAISQQAG